MIAPTGRCDKHDADRAAASGGCCQICSCVPRLQIGGDAGAVDQQRGEEQHDVAEVGCDHDPDAAEGACEVAGAQSSATTQILADTPHANSCSSRANGEEDRRQSREAAGAQHLLGEQCADCNASRQTGAAQDLREQQNREGPPLLRGLLEERWCWSRLQASRSC